MKAAIKVGEQMFLGRSHSDALMAALKSNIPMDLKRQATRALETKNSDTGFSEDGINFISREDARKKYGCSTSEEMVARGLM